MASKKNYLLLLALFSAIIAFTLSCIGAFGCNFVEFVTPKLQTSRKAFASSVTKSRHRDGLNSTRKLEITHNQSGLWSYEWWDSSIKQYTCHPYPQRIQIDPKWKAARALSTLTIIIGGLYILSVPLYWVINCGCHSFSLQMRRKQKQYRYQLGATTCLLACVCETFSLILFLRSNACQDNVIFNLMSSHNCQMSTGAKCTYAAMVFWFLAGFLLEMNINSINVRGELSRGEEDANLEESLLQEVV